jgi:RNA polymerase sigma factor (sigma-70 family)
MSNNNQATLDLLYQSLKAGNMEVFKSYYNQYKLDFIQFGRKYSSDEEMILDAYHDSFIVLYENVISRKLVELRSSLKTYLFSIGKFTIYNKLKKNQKVRFAEELDLKDDEFHLHPISFDQTEEKEEMMKYFDQLGEACKSLLTLFYYKRYSIEAMVKALGYKNENTVKAYKSRCLKKLKEIIIDAQKNPKA